MRSAINLCCVLLGVMGMTSGCFRGRPSDRPPVHINPNMDRQEKYTAQGESRFFPNRSAMRPLVPGTIGRGELREDTIYYEGKDATGAFVKTLPVPVNMALLTRGRERFTIYCAVCHGESGKGDGIIIRRNRGMIPPPSFHEARLVKIEDGYIFDVITNGIRNMSSYRHQVPVDDRWAIVSYLRALQTSQSATRADLPEAELQRLQ